MGNKFDPAYCNSNNLMGYVQCRNCGRQRPSRPRGLCWNCYYNPGIRNVYPSESIYGKKGIGDFNGEAILPEPCNFPPGSDGKIKVLEERAQLRKALFHPLDKT